MLPNFFFSVKSNSGINIFFCIKPSLSPHTLFFFFSNNGKCYGEGCDFILFYCYFGCAGPSLGACLVALVVKNLPANAEDARDLGSIPGSERSPGGGNSNPLQYSLIPRTEEPGRLQSMGSQRVRYDWAHTHARTGSCCNAQALHTGSCYEALA